MPSKKKKERERTQKKTYDQEVLIWIKLDRVISHLEGFRYSEVDSLSIIGDNLVLWLNRLRVDIQPE